MQNELVAYSYHGTVYVLDYESEWIVSTFKVQKCAGTLARFRTPGPVLMNIDEDPALEILVTPFYEWGITIPSRVVALEYSPQPYDTGQKIKEEWTVHIPYAPNGTLAIGNFDEDDNVEAVMLSFFTATAYAYEINNSIYNEKGWRFFHHDAQRTGLADYTNDYPQFQFGPGCKGRLPFSGPLKSPKLIWSYSIDEKITSISPVIDQFSMIYGGFHNKLVHLDTSGRLRWSYVTEEVIKSSPVVDRDGKIIFTTNESKLHVLHPDGRLFWSHDFGGNNLSSPKLGNRGKIYLISSGNKQKVRKIYSIDRLSRILWTIDIPEVNFDKKIIPPSIDQQENIYVNTNKGNLYSIDNKGRIRWFYETDGKLKSYPVVDNDNSVYISCSSKIYKLNGDGKLLWSYHDESCKFTSISILSNNNCVTGSIESGICCVSRSGKLLWKWGIPEGDRITTSILIDNDSSIYFGTASGYIYCIKNVDDNPQLQWNFKIGGSSITSSITLDRMGRILFGTEKGEFYCIGETN